MFGKTRNGISEPAPISSYVLNAQTGSFEKNSTLQADSASTFNFSTEFSPSIEVPAQHIIKKTTDLTWLSATVELSYTTCNPHLVFSITDKQGNKVIWRSGEKKHQLEGTTGTMWLAQRMTMKEFDRKNHLIKCYLWNPDG